MHGEKGAETSVDEVILEGLVEEVSFQLSPKDEEELEVLRTKQGESQMGSVQQKQKP